MEYVTNHEGGFLNESVRIPATFNHVTQFLYHVKDENWRHFQNAAREALEGRVQFPVKIKPSSLRAVHKSRAAALVRPLILEHLAHHDPKSESHRGGGYISRNSVIIPGCWWNYWRQKGEQFFRRRSRA